MKNSFYTKFVVLFTLIAVLGFLYQPSALAFVGGSVEQGVQSAQGTGQPTDLFGTGGIFTTVAPAAITASIIFAKNSLSALPASSA